MTNAFVLALGLCAATALATEVTYVEQCEVYGMCFCHAQNPDGSLGPKIGRTARRLGDVRAYDCASIPPCILGEWKVNWHATVPNDQMRIPPACKRDGTYEEYQFNKVDDQSRPITELCVTFDGLEIAGSRAVVFKRDKHKCAKHSESVSFSASASPSPSPSTINCDTIANSQISDPATTYIASCNDDGTFQSLQCDISLTECWCSYLNGEEIEDTRHDVNSTEPIDCDFLVASTPSPSPSGVPQIRMQCHKKTCWCVDDNGREILGTHRHHSKHDPDDPSRCLTLAHSHHTSNDHQLPITTSQGFAGLVAVMIAAGLVARRRQRIVRSYETFNDEPAVIL